MRGRVLTEIVRVLPPMSQLSIMFLDDHLQEPIVQPPAFIRGHVVYLYNVITNCKKTLPSGDGVSANDWVDGAERGSNVVWGPARLGVELISLLSS